MSATPAPPSDAAARHAFLPIGGRRTRVALVGTGFIAATHAEVLRGIGEVELVGVCDVDLAKAERFARAHGIAIARRRVGELAGSCAPDAAHVLVPPALHGAVARECLEAGLHVLVEKPLVLASAEAHALAALAASCGLRLGVNHNFALHPLFLRLLADVRAGRIGRVEHVVSVQNNPLRQLAAGDFGNWLFASPRNVFFEQGPHALSQIRALLGEIEDVSSRPEGRRDLPGGRVFFDTWRVSMRAGRATSDLFLAFGREHPESWVHAIGQDGSIRADLLRGAYAIRGKTRWPDALDAWLANRAEARAWRRAASEALLGYALPLLRLRPRRDPFFLGIAASLRGFHRALREGSEPPSSARDGLAIVDLCERATEPAAAEALARPPAPPAPVVEFAEPRADEVAVLGATGFLGGHVVERLVGMGVPVRLLVRRPEVLAPHLRHPLVRIVRGSLGDASALDRAIAGADAVVHLASGGGDAYADFERTIVEGTDAVAERCVARGVRRLVYTSTVAVYDFRGRGRVTEESPLDSRPLRRSHYARAKIESERRLASWQRERGLRCVILRPAVVVGRRGRPLHSGVGQWPRDTQCVGWGSGTTPIPLVLAADVADAIVRALEATGVEGESFNLAGDVRPTAREYVAELRRATGRPFEFHPTPLWLLQANDLLKWVVKVMIRKPGNVFPSYRDLATRAFRAPLDCEKAKRVLGWRPEADRARFVRAAIDEALEES